MEGRRGDTLEICKADYSRKDGGIKRKNQKSNDERNAEQIAVFSVAYAFGLLAAMKHSLSSLRCG